MGYRVRVSSVADDGGLKRIRLYTQQQRLTYTKQITNIKLTTWPALTNREQARQRALAAKR